MQLTRHTDYSLRVLAYLCLKNERAVNISEIADYYSISRNHLVKVVHHLSSTGFIITTRGKGGGIRLAHKAIDICIGDVVRKMEPHFDIAECFNSDNPKCTIEPICVLKSTLYEAKNAFIAVLDKYTLADTLSKEPNEGLNIKVE